MNRHLKKITYLRYNMKALSLFPNNKKSRKNRSNLQCDWVRNMQKLKQKHQINNIKITGKEISN